MKKFYRIFILQFFPLLLISSTLSAQIHYKLLAEPADNSAQVEFSADLPVGATFVRWEINAETFLSTPVTYTFDISTTTDFSVSLFYSDPALVEVASTINVNAPLFAIIPDQELGDLASLKRIFRSAFEIPANTTEAIGSWRFDWFINDVKPTDISFPAPFGDYPNVYHTFSNGGNYTIKLLVTNVDDVNYVSEFSQTIALEPIFGADKIDFNPIPNVFTPNGDGNNDTFQVVASGNTTLSFKVFARTGVLVYQFEGNVIKWDGKNYYGKDIPDGIYYYTLEDIGEKNYNPASGFFYILRGKE